MKLPNVSDLKYLKIILLKFLLLSSTAVLAVSTVSSGKRGDRPVEKFYPVCSPFSVLGEPCIWNSGIEVPIKSTGLSQFTTMVTIVLPTTNKDWELYRANMLFSIEYVYKNDCVLNLVEYKNDADTYKNDTVCR